MERRERLIAAADRGKPGFAERLALQRDARR